MKTIMKFLAIIFTLCIVTSCAMIEQPRNNSRMLLKGVRLLQEAEVVVTEADTTEEDANGNVTADEGEQLTAEDLALMEEVEAIDEGTDGNIETETEWVAEEVAVEEDEINPPEESELVQNDDPNSPAQSIEATETEIAD